MFVGQNKIREDLAAETRRLVNIEVGPSRAEGCRSGLAGHHG